ncbi:MAG: hypothetical protein HC888_12685 [Candidatus Competibacteraceae bacterium]|nr:hypothetical protein [Candidatus Competibacteraceae bacterium]
MRRDLSNNPNVSMTPEAITRRLHEALEMGRVCRELGRSVLIESAEQVRARRQQESATKQETNG